MHVTFVLGHYGSISITYGYFDSQSCSILLHTLVDEKLHDLFTECLNW